jgi:hypothetical protein
MKANEHTKKRMKEGGGERERWRKQRENMISEPKRKKR